MEDTDMVRKVDRLGRIGIPVKLRRELNIEMSDDIEIFLEDDFVILKKFHVRRPCIITGQVSEKNLEFADGKIVLSPEGVRVLLQELKKCTSNKNSIVI
ncbi:AbrB/MazE/SpoVT family DNA-binding domain-containing protein [Fictibacillus phosphorivorans]|uniref:AbrB/MazE/SpoVT family DNA-binding domain-containing protein n=1 Tax=Fictibacillus phosphorivorans TaxID=1221500 RepID=UPI003CFB270A